MAIKSEKSISIIGAGTYGEAMAELANLVDYKVEGFYDEDEQKINTLVMETKVVGKFSDLGKKDIEGKNFIVAIGNNRIRYDIMMKINDLGGRTPSIIHPKATICPSATIGKGVYIQAGAYIWTKVSLGDFCIISPNVVVAHHTSVGKACLLSTLSGIGASINIEDQVFVGMGATIVTGLESIGENAIVGAGAVVLKNIEKNSVYAGIPAKKIRDLKN